MKKSMFKMYEILSRNEGIDFHKSQKEKPALIRHLIRYSYYSFGCTLSGIAELEEEFTGKKPHHATILNSISTIESIISNDVIKTVPYKK